jgi:hypothetical protein
VAAVAQGAVSSVASPLLELWVVDSKLIVDPDADSLSFTLVDVSTEDKECVPVTVFGPQVVDLTADRIGTDVGHFAARFTLPAAEPLGAHEILWSWTLKGKPQSYAQRFDVLAGVPRGLGWGYALVSDFRAEGIDAKKASDLRLLKLIKEQSEWIEQVTGRFFEPRFMDTPIDGTDSLKLLLGYPILALQGVSILDDPIAIDPASRELVVYNRHLRGLLEPDDRDAPRVEIPEVFPLLDAFGSYANDDASSFVLRTSFPQSAQNVRVQGLFGYTDPDGSPLGRMPTGIRKALLLLVMRNLPSLACETEGFDARFVNRVTSMETRDQKIHFASKGLGEGGFTGDIEIDNLLSLYARPIRLYAT